MKIFLVLMLALSANSLTARADIPAPKPTSITVSNLAAFPKYKFSYRLGEQQETKPIPDSQPFTATTSVELLVQSGSDPAQTWERIKYEWRGTKVAIKVENVKQDGKTITVTYKTTNGDGGPNKKSAALPQSLPLFAVAGLGTCGLVLLMRRREGGGAE